MKTISIDVMQAKKKIETSQIPVVLVGMMGAGKSAIGAGLAQALSVPFVDVDACIEAQEDRTITDIFAQEGEAFFREVEAAATLKAFARGACVVATGGGAVQTPAILEAIKKDSTKSIWLKADLETLWARVRMQSHRPLLEQEDPRQTLADLLARREKLYAQADYVLDVSQKDVQQNVDAAIKLLCE